MRIKIENKIKMLQGRADSYNEIMIDEIGEAERACKGVNLDAAIEHLKAAKEAEQHADRYYAQVHLLKQLLND